MLKSFIESILENNTKEIALKKLEILERQKYNYYEECSDGWTTEECEKYNKEWDLILTAINELKNQT